MNVSNKFSIKTTRYVGSSLFFLSLSIFNIVWLFWNIYAPNSLVFDPAPTFQTWLFISNIIQIELMPLILLGGNVQSDRMERLLERDLKIDKESRERGDRVLSLLYEIDKKIKG